MHKSNVSQPVIQWSQRNDVILQVLLGNLLQHIICWVV